MNNIYKLIKCSFNKYHIQSAERLNITFRGYSNSIVISNRTNDNNDLVEVERELNLLNEKCRSNSVLESTNEDLSHFTKNVGPTFNIAPLVNNSPILTDLIKLGVNLHKIEKKNGAFDLISRLDYEKDFKKYISFLADFVQPEGLGLFITKNPFIFQESIEDMNVRINYLQSKKFTKNMIQSIIDRNPFWLNFSTKRIDNRLGWFQTQFELNGDEVRKVAVAAPRLITYNLRHVECNKFSVLEEMGFEKNECKELIINHPRLWMLKNQSLMDRFIYVHETMEIPHDVILKMPTILYCRTSRLRERHTFLGKIGRAQYDSTKPNYISLMNIAEGNDAEFCLNVAKCSITEYNSYLKSI